LREWWRAARKKGWMHPGQPWLFPGYRGQHMSRRQLHRMYPVDLDIVTSGRAPQCNRFREQPRASPLVDHIRKTLKPLRLGASSDRRRAQMRCAAAMSSLRASATIIVLRVPARRSAVRAWYHRASCREFQQQRSSSHSSLGTAPIAEAAPPAPIFTAPT
jgi:hypothetical protein